MVMGKRPEVKTASAPVAAFAVAGLAAQLATSLASVPFRRPWRGPAGLEPRDERVSVADADLQRFPPTFVAVGGDEMFRDPIRRFVERLERSGVDTMAVEEPGMFHVYPILMPWADASRRVYRAVGAFARKRLERAAREGTEAEALRGI